MLKQKKQGLVLLTLTVVFLCVMEKKNVFAYLDHRTVDGKYNIITDVFITKGNYHDTVCYIDRLDYQINKFNFDVLNVGLDAGYMSAPICHQLTERGIYGVIGYRAPGGKKEFIRKNKFKYDKVKDVYVCPQGEYLHYKKQQEMDIKNIYQIITNVQSVSF